MTSNSSAYFTGSSDFCIAVEGSAQSCSTREGDEDWRREETSELDAPGAIRPPQSAERGRPEELLQHETTFPLPVHTGHGELAWSGNIIGMQKRPQHGVCAAPDTVFCFVEFKFFFFWLLTLKSGTNFLHCFLCVLALQYYLLSMGNITHLDFWLFLMSLHYCIWGLFSLLLWHDLPFVSCTSLEDQMEQAAIVYCELLEGKEGPVAGSTREFLALSVIVKLILYISMCQLS